MNHIEQTIMELTVLRDRADELIDGLRDLQRGLYGAPDLCFGEIVANPSLACLSKEQIAELRKQNRKHSAK